MTSVRVVAVGGFGEEVAARVAATLDATVVRSWEDDGCADAAVWLLAAWRPAPELASRLDAFAFAHRTPWIPVVAEHPYLVVGPTVVPGVGPCYRCFRRRLSQHGVDDELTELLHAHYDADPAAGPHGHLPAVATVAAAMACEAIERVAREPEAEAGRVRRLDLQTLHLLAGSVVGVHGCPRCGGVPRPAGALREELSRD